MPRSIRGPVPKTWTAKNSAALQGPDWQVPVWSFTVTASPFALSPSTLTSNSSRTSEILAHGLTLLSRKLDMRGAHLSLQGDNCCKEVKNNGQLRLLGCWIASGKLKSADLSFLSSGHSHEDVDAMFGAIRGFLESEPELHTPQAFQQHLAKFFDEPTRRPHEKRPSCCHAYTVPWLAPLIPDSSVILMCLCLPTKWPWLYNGDWHLMKTLTPQFWSCSHPDRHFPARKSFFEEHFHYMRLKGVGGPGAPHLFRLERLGDSGQASENVSYIE